MCPGCHAQRRNGTQKRNTKKQKAAFLKRLGIHPAQPIGETIKK
jgi:hypothetical protein